MLKVKVLFSREADEFEKEINKFIEGKIVKDIKFSTDFAMNEIDKEAYYNALIIYEETL